MHMEGPWTWQSGGKRIIKKVAPDIRMVVMKLSLRFLTFIHNANYNEMSNLNIVVDNCRDFC